MADEVKKIAKPQMRGLLMDQIRRNLILSAISCTVGGILMFVYGDSRKRAYANFYKNYNINKEFHRIRRMGLFDSCDPYEEAEDEDEDDDKKE